MSGVLENEKGPTKWEGESKLRNLEQTYLLNVPCPSLFTKILALGKGDYANYFQ